MQRVLHCPTPRMVPVHASCARGCPVLNRLWAVLQLKRTHFHDFMLDVHRRLRGLSHQSDPLAQVANDICDEIKVRALSMSPALLPAAPIQLSASHMGPPEKGARAVMTCPSPSNVLRSQAVLLFPPFRSAPFERAPGDGARKARTRRMLHVKHASSLPTLSKLSGKIGILPLPENTARSARPLP